MRLMELRIKLVYFCLFLTSCFIQSILTKGELVMVQMISRHGDVSPLVLYPKDPNPEQLWPEGLNDLTMLGKYQPYAMGLYLRNLYNKFITSDPREVQVMSSSDVDSVKSAQSIMAALYAPTSNWEIARNFSWQPIYIPPEKESDKKFLSKPPCPAADAEYEKVLEKETFWQNYQYLILYWQMNSGMKLRNIDDIETLVNTLYSEAAYNMTIPNWALIYWNDLKHLHALAFRLKLKTKLLQRLRGGPLADLTIRRMEEKLSDGLNSTKVFVYSTHGFNIAAYLSAMGLWNGVKPNPSTTVLIELYRLDENAYVRYLYMNSTTPEREPRTLHLLTVPGCTEFCPLEYIIEQTKSAIPKNWDQECQEL